MIEPPVWTPEQLEIHRLKAIAIFRNERMQEPLEDYLEAFEEYQGHIEELLETTVDLSQLESTALDVLTDPHLLEAFRYLAGPPISQDDLKVLAEATSLAKRPSAEQAGGRAPPDRSRPPSPRPPPLFVGSGEPRTN
jgi:hypothetical protein